MCILRDRLGQNCRMSATLNEVCSSTLPQFIATEILLGITELFHLISSCSLRSWSGWWNRPGGPINIDQAEKRAENSKLVMNVVRQRKLVGRLLFSHWPLASLKLWHPRVYAAGTVRNSNRLVGHGYNFTVMVERQWHRVTCTCFMGCLKWRRARTKSTSARSLLSHRNFSPSLR